MSFLLSVCWTCTWSGWPDALTIILSICAFCVVRLRLCSARLFGLGFRYTQVCCTVLVELLKYRLSLKCSIKEGQYIWSLLSRVRIRRAVVIDPSEFRHTNTYKHSLAHQNTSLLPSPQPNQQSTADTLRSGECKKLELALTVTVFGDVAISIF